jgi:NAD(P)-dependent dehydrogenase (short-subunit alcohol dehydrogenase family)
MAVAVVTGSSRGIGREICRQLVALDYVVVAGARNPADVDIEGVHPLALDITSDQSVDAAAEHVQGEFGGASVLINNAGVTYADYTLALDPAIDFDKAHDVMEVNLFGTWRAARAFAPQLRVADHARMVNLSSEMARISHAGTHGGPYRASKAALNMLTKVFSEELKDDGVLVNAVCPGWCSTDMSPEPEAPRTAQQGAASAVWAATLADDGPTGGFFQDGNPLEW